MDRTAKRRRLAEQIAARRAVHKAVFGKHPRRSRIPAPIRPSAVSTAYLSAIMSQVVEPATVAIRSKVLTQLQEWTSEADRERGDSSTPFVYTRAMRRADAAQSKARAILERLAKESIETSTPTILERLAARFAKRTSDYQKTQWRRQVKAATGVDLVTHEPNLEPRLQQFVEENVSLIKTIPARLHAEVEGVVMRGLRSGQRHEDLAEDIEERFDVAESNAARIARDQVGKLFGQLAGVRQQALGITGYTWRGVGDNRERPEHEAREGESFDWDDPPDGGHPGEDVNCRCWSEANFEEVLAEL